MRKFLSLVPQFKWYLLFAFGVIGGKVYSDYNNINIWPASNETQADSQHSGARGHYFYRGGGNHHK